MERHYTVPHFFRQMPNALLKRYFMGRDLFADIDFDAMKETKPEALVAAWEALPDTTRRAIEPQFYQIFELSCDKGFQAIKDEAAFHLGNDPQALMALIEALASLKSHYARAMTVFLDHHQLWNGAAQFYGADTLSFWRKRRGLPLKAAAIDPESREALRSEIAAWFRGAEGRGRNCRVELLRRDTRDYFFAYPEDYANEQIEWVADEFNRRAHTPAFEVVFVWSADEGTLDLNHRGDGKAKETLQAIFARTILKLDQLPPALRDERVYQLDGLKRRDFQFVRAVDSGIDAVSVRKLRLSSTVRKGDRLTLEADVRQNRLALHDVLEQAGKAFPLGLWNVTMAEIAADLAATTDKPARRVTFTVAWPDSCSLKYDEVGLKLRAMLTASGIEVR